jgi:GNAT superfamily N-acetyltransferase
VEPAGAQPAPVSFAQRAKPFSFTSNPSGTITVQGNPAKIRAVLSEYGITNMVPTKSGIMVGKSQAVRAQEVLSTTLTAAAPTPVERALERVAVAEEKRAAPKSEPVKVAEPQIDETPVQARPVIEKPVDGTYVLKIGGAEVGRANVADSGDYLTSIRIEPEHQRKGLGTLLQDHIENDLGRKLRPSPTYETPAGKAFSEKRAAPAPEQPTAAAKPQPESKVAPTTGEGSDSAMAAMQQRRIPTERERIADMPKRAAEKRDKLTANPFKTFLIRNGIALRLARDFAPGTRERLSMGRTFRADGLELDALAERAAEQGYIRDRMDTDELYELISKVANGERVAPMYGQDAETEMAALVDRQRQLEQDAAEAVGELADESVLAIEENDDSIPWDTVSNVSEADAMRDLGFTEQEISDATTARKDRAQESGAGNREPVQAAAREAQGNSGRRDQEARAEEGLTSPTPADILAQQDRAAQAERDTKAADKAAADKAKADAERDEFRLSGSDRAADANPDQGAMFSRAEPFYSALSREVSAINAKAQAADGWRAQIQGLVKAGKVKADEVEWTGLNDWLKLQTGKVTKEQITDYLKANGVQVQEVTLGGLSEEAQRDKDFHDQNVEFAGDKLSLAIAKAGDYIANKFGQVAAANATLAFNQDRPGQDSAGLEKAYELLGKAAPESYDINTINDAQDEFDSAEQAREMASQRWRPATKYGSYTLPGGEDYREVLLTLPQSWGKYLADFRARFPNSETTDAELRKDFDAGRANSFDGAYRSSHWDTPNVLAHIRLNDRTDAEGKKVLFVEELQSDWAQQGRKDGFDNEARFQELIRRRDAAPDDGPQQDELQRQIDDMAANGGKGVPSAPFVGKTDAWLTLALKRIVKMAVDEGYDRVAFVNGEQSAERYDLSKHVSKVWYQKATDGRFEVSAENLDGREINGVAGLMDGQKIADTFGKDIADKITSGVQDGEQNGVSYLEGNNLKVGGEGMKAFYDSIVPNAAKDVIRKLGGQMAEVQVDRTSFGKNGRPADWNPRDGAFSAQPGFDITPAMREKAAAGLPLFSRPFATKAEANDATLKNRGTTAVSDDNGGWLLAPVARPYTEQERQDAQRRVDVLNAALVRWGVQPAVPLSDAPTGAMARGRSLARTFGIDVTFIEENRDFDGVASTGQAFVSRNTKHPEIGIIGHEVLHVFKQTNPQGYQGLADQIRGYLKDGVVEAKQKWEDAQGGQNTSLAKAEEEVIADLNGAMWLDPLFWREMAQNDPSLFRQVAYKFMEVASKAVKNLSRFKADALVTDVAAVRKIIAKEWAMQAQENEGGTEFTKDGGLPAFLRVFHGSPHEFDSFDMSKVGTGEGAQAYGYGLYFAGNREVADYYRRTLSERTGTVDGTPINPRDPSHIAAGNLYEAKGERAKAISELRDALDSLHLYPDGAEPIYREAVRMLESGETIPEYKPAKGKLYEVEIPEDGKYVLWDKPLSEQSPAVAEMLNRAGMYDELSKMGGNVYQNVAAIVAKQKGRTIGSGRLKKDQQAASEYLHSLGIAGIKYMDGASRNRPLRELKREFLKELPQDAEFDEVLDLIGSGTFSPANETILKALAANDWLGFDYPAQAVSAALGENLSNYDASPELVQAVADAQSGATFNYVVFDDSAVKIEAAFSRADEISPGDEFWAKIKAGDSFSPEELQDAYSIGRRGTRRAGRSLGESGARSPKALSTDAFSWEGKIAGFDGYRTLGAARGDGAQFMVSAIPERLWTGSDDASVDDTSIVGYLFEKLGEGKYRLDIVDPAPGTSAFDALQKSGSLKATGITPKGQHEYHRVDLGITLSRALLQEAVRRLALHDGVAPSVVIAGRETGARAGDMTPREYRAEIKFSRSAVTGQTLPQTAPKLSPWRDELGRVQFAPGAWLENKLGQAASPLLNKLALKAASPELRKALREMKLTVAKAQETAAAVAAETNKMSADERELVSDLIEKEVKAGTVPPAHAVKLAATINATFEAQTDELVRLGMLTKDSADRWRGQYLPRYYESKLTKGAADLWANAMRGLGRKAMMRGIKGKHLKGRGISESVTADSVAEWEAQGWEVRDPDYPKATADDINAMILDGKIAPEDQVQVWRDYTREERDKMGEIRDAGFRFVMGYMQTQKDIALGRMFEQLAANPEMSSRLPTERFTVQVPETKVSGTGAKTYGKLAGRYVSEETLSQLSVTEEAQNELLQMYRKAMGLWKEGKVVLNPVSHVNNTVSNLTMAHFAGVGYHRADKYLAAMRDFAKQSPDIKEAKEAGLFLGTMSDAELMNVLPEELKILAQKQEGTAQKVGRHAFNLLSFYLRKPMGWAYQAEDTFFRYLVYKEARSRGMEPTDAVDYAQKFIFTYDDLPKGARRIRDYGMPFFAYTYKAIPALLHTAMTHPDRFAAPAALLWFANAAAYAIGAGDDDESWDQRLRKYVTDPEYRAQVRAKEKLEREHLPPWMKGTTALGTPKAIRLGMDEVTKLPLFMDTSRLIPGGDLFDVNPNAGGVDWLPQPFTPSHPLFTTAVGMLANKDLWLGKDLTDSNDTSGEKFDKRADWLWKQFAPAIAVNNYHWERGMNALANATGKELTYVPDAAGGDATGIGRDGLPVQPKLAAMQTFGIKVRPYDLDKAEQIETSVRRKMIREIDAEMRSLKRLNNLGALSDRAYEKARDLADTKKDRLKEGKTIDGAEKD